MNIAIITGASSGLGREYARLLSNEPDLDELWLIARRQPRLERLQEELPATCRLIPCDLTAESSLTLIQQQLAAVAAPEIRWLINAAGFGRIGRCTGNDRVTSARLIALNCRAAVSLTQAALPFMAAGSHIMEICSCAAFQPIPYLAAYAASKAFLLSYSRALGAELAPQHIEVTAVCPYWVRDTEFITHAIESDHSGIFQGFPLTCSQTEVAERSLRAARNHVKVCTPDMVSFLHRIAASIFPHSWLLYISEFYRRFA